MFTDYPETKRGWLNLLKEQGEKRGIEVDLHIGEQAFIIENGVIGRVRATLKQSPPMNFVVDDERKFLKQDGLEKHGQDHMYTVMLDVDNRGQFDPDTDRFYPLPKRILESTEWVKRKPSDGHYLLKVNPYQKPVERWQNDWSKLFNPDSNGKNPGRYSDGGPDPPPQVAQLQKIAEKIES